MTARTGIATTTMLQAVPRRLLAGASNLGVAMVGHDGNHTARTSDHVIAMGAGSVAAPGPPEKVLTPAQLFEISGIESDVIARPQVRQPVCVPRGEAGPVDPPKTLAGSPRLITFLGET